MEKIKNMQKLSNTLLPNRSKKNYKASRKCLETNKNEKTAHTDLWDIANAILRGKFIVINT